MTTLLVFGDSIVWGAWDSEGGWVARLRKEIDKKNLLDPDFYCSIYNLGISGDTSTGLLSRFLSEAKIRINIEQEDPIIILAIGTNDAKFFINKQNHKTNQNQFRKNIAQLIMQATSLTSKVIMLSPVKVDESKVNTLPKNTERMLYNKDFTVFAKIIQEEAHKEDVHFLNLQTSFDIKTMLHEDGLHPNEKGHEYMFQKVKEFLIGKKLLSL
ncbi:MAG: SGNH/GDSL hydrolase family protein [Nanoarchaeota archaeon]